MLIGCFIPNVNVNAISVSWGVAGFTYYYIDSVIVEPIATPPLTAPITHVNVSCYGGNNGSATIVPYGGQPPYTYLWTPGNFTTATINNLSAGTYTCTVTDATNNTVTQSVTITQPLSLAATVIATTNADCGVNNGFAGVSVIGGTQPYAYSWWPYGGNFSVSCNWALVHIYAQLPIRMVVLIPRKLRSVKQVL